MYENSVYMTRKKTWVLCSASHPGVSDIFPSGRKASPFRAKSSCAWDLSSIRAWHKAPPEQDFVQYSPIRQRILSWHHENGMQAIPEFTDRQY